MEDILIISTGGTFNKYYQPSNGTLVVDRDGLALQDIADRWMSKFNLINIIGKDSLDMNDEDRAKLLERILASRYKKIVVVHGTDTMDKSAQTIAEAELDKIVIFTGAMTPYSIERVEATANLAMALGYLHSNIASGVYISMNGIVDEYRKVTKNRQIAKFERV